MCLLIHQLVSSQFKFALLSHCEYLFCAVLKPARSSYSFDGPVTLHLYFTVLLPASNLHGHVIKGDLLFEELVHLPLDGVLISRLNEGRSVVDAGHGVEVFVLARVHAAAPEVIIK